MNKVYIYSDFVLLSKNKLDTNDSLPPFNSILTNQYTDGELYAYLTDFRNKLNKKDEESIRFFINLIEQELLKRKLR